jgi:hypothetical protein
MTSVERLSIQKSVQEKGRTLKEGPPLETLRRVYKASPAYAV